MIMNKTPNTIAARIAYATEYARMKHLGHSESFATIAAIKASLAHLVVS